MKLTPQHAPLYGECVLTVQLDDSDAGEEEEKELEFYLSFSGSTQRHVSSTLRVSHSTLQAVCPAVSQSQQLSSLLHLAASHGLWTAGHDVCEQVVVTLCVACPGKPVATLSEEAFSFDQDLALDMARFLLDTTAPEEALLLDDEQIPLKECERLDQNLALALKHLSLCHPRTAPQTSALTCAQTITAPDTHTQKEARPCVSVLSDSNTAVSQSQQLSSLLHLAASHGLWTVASFLLQQPGAREALRMANARGQTPVCVAQGKGHEKLVELFTQYETSSDVKVEPKDQLLWHQEGRLLQHHAKHSTYTITFCCRQQMEAGAKTDRGERCGVQKEVEELRRLIKLHKLESCAATTTEKYACFDCDLQPYSSRQHNSRHDASRLVVNTENSNTTAEKQGSPQWQQEPCRSAAHKVVEGQRHTTATKSPTGRKKKNKKRTTKTTRHATAGNNSSSLKAGRLDAQGLSKITARDCVPEAGASVSLKGLALSCKISEGGVTSSSGTDKTQPVSVLADDEKCTGRKATTAITEKQESEKWEVDALMCEQATEKETEAAVNQSPSTRQDQCVESTERRADTMGQEQSQDLQESQSESEELRQPDSTNQAQSDSRTSPRSPDVEGKPLTGLWRDGGWIGSRMESDTVANTIWYQGEHMDQGGIEASNRQEVNSQTVWYDYDEQTQEQLKKTKWDLSFPQKYDKSPSQLLEQGFSSHQLCSALSQPHAAGAQPALSHGLATQRQEVQGSRQEEEVGPDWQEGGEEEVWNRESTHSRKNSETADLEEWGEEKPEEREAKGRKKRRRKKWKRRSSEAKLSSSSSVESYNQNETHTEKGTSLNCQSKAKDQTERTHVCSLTFSEPTWVGEEADKDTMHLPSQTRGSHQPDCAVITSESSCTRPTNHAGPDQAEPVLSQTLEIKEPLMDESVSIHGSDHFDLDSTVAASELCDMSIKKADGEEINPGQPKGNDVFGPTELDLKGHTSPTVDDMESNALSPHQCRTVAVAPGEPTVLVECNFPKELPIKTTGPTGLTEDLLLVVFPEENKVDAQSEDKPVQPVNLMEKPSGLMESVHPSIAQCLPCEGTADVRPLEIQEGSPETTHCLSSNMLRDLQLKEENRHEPLAGNEDGKETSWRRDNRDCRVMDSEVLSSVEQGQNLEFPPSKTEHLSNDDLVITAAAVVTVAIASAMARIELSQQLSSATGSSISTLVQDTNEPIDKHSHAKLSNDLDSDSHDSVSETLESQPKTKTLCSPLVPKEKIQSETIVSEVFPCLLSDHHKLLQVNMSPLPETHERITAEVDSQGHIQPQVQPPCPPLDTGQESELDTATADTLSKANNSPQDQSAGQTHRDGLSSALHETHPAATDGSDPAPSLTGEAVGQGHEHEKASPERPVNKTDGSHVEEHESDPQLVEHLHDGEILTLPLLPSPALLAVLSPPVTDPCPEELEALACTESEELQLCEWPEDSKPVTGTFQSEGNEPFAVDDVCDEDCASLELVDGWNRSEGEKLELVEEARKDMLTVQDTPQKGAEIFPTSEGEYEQTKRHSDNPHNVQIQREKDFCCPVQPCPQPSTDASCIDARPGRDDAVSVCVLQKGCERLQGTSDRDDGVFKKPFSPLCAGHGDKGVRVPVDVPVLADITPSQCTANTVDSESESLCLKPEIQTAAEGFSGGVTKGRGRAEKEEKKVHLSESLLSSAILRASLRSLSPLRRHSWEPCQSSSCKDTGITQRSSLKSLSGKARRAKPPLHRRSMSWCPSNLCRPDQEQIENRSYSLERLEVQRASLQSQSDQEERTAGQSSHLDSQERGSLISLTEEEQEGDGISIDSQASSEGQPVANICPAMFHHQPLSKSASMDTISHRNIDVRGFSPSKRRITFSLSISPLLTKNRRFFSIASSSSDDDEEEEGGRLSSFSSNASTLEYSISEEEPGPLRSETEGKVQGPKISRTFSYLRSKMSKKVKEKEKRGDRERDREKKSNGHVFIQLSPSPSSACQHCTKLLHKEPFLCSGCGVQVHKSCRDNLPVCIKSKAKQQLMVPDAGPGTTVNIRSKTALSASSISSTSSSSLGERWSTLTSPDEQFSAFPWRPSNNLHSNLSKSVSISNIAGLEDAPLKGLKFLSQSTDNLHQGSKVNASTESLTDEGTEMMDSQLMGEFECDVKDLEADSWSSTVDKKFLKTLKKDEIKRQDVIYELFQTEFHHVRTLKIMFEVYYKGLQKEIQLDTQTLDKIFPVLDKLLDIHTQFLSRLLEMKRTSSAEGRNSSLLICRIGKLLVTQFSDTNADHMKKAYGKFCSRHNEAVNLYKDLHAKDKRFQAFIKKTMSSSIVRRLSIPECILLVTQRITKYPVLIQRILQHTKDSDEDHGLVSEALRCVKELITAVDSKVNEHEKKCRLREVYSRTDSKSIMRMKSGQMFAKEDLIRRGKLLHDGALQLKNSAGRLKDVHALLLSDVLVFLQEKDQKYVFASLDQRSTVMSMQNLIVREVANEERGLFLITAGTDRPEMVEVLASSKEERNSWRAVIQDAMHCMEKDEDEGVPSETEEDRKQQENRAKEIRELLRSKDKQIVSLLEEKVHIFRELSDCPSTPEDVSPQIREGMLFRATPYDVTRGEPIITNAIREVESLHTLVHRAVGGAGCSSPVGLAGGSIGPVCLPRRAETFGGFDSHQMNSSKNGEKEEGDESLDLRRTESDSLLKKGAAASLQMLLKKNNEQVQQSVSHLHHLLISLQAVVVQQDSFIEDQRQALNDRLTGNCSRHSSSSSLSSSSSSRPSSLIEQEKHRSLERQRQEAASLQKQQAAYQEERRRREREWELKERGLGEWEERLREEEEETRKRHQELVEERESLQRKKEEFQREVERLREAQKKLERDKETLRRETEQLEAMRKDESEQLYRYQRTPSSTSEESLRFHSSGSLDVDSKEAAEPPKEVGLLSKTQVELSSSAPTKEPFLRIGSKRMSKSFNPFSSSSSSKHQGAEKESQLPTRLLQLAKPKEKKDKKKKKGKGGAQAQTEATVMLDTQHDGDIFFC
ncbi:A-kinase anchor protein 13-like isoform X4 [Betta splendens]|uniref:A-kinase anchor protein 13-like isoform X4 n=1 Tax=Betta splendens TaxID=158456 RepID=A0A9W2XUU0_BETSP|nr:A-kinase anchor protein 13-like isoform X4 [Betta splendens]